MKAVMTEKGTSVTVDTDWRCGLVGIKRLFCRALRGMGYPDPCVDTLMVTERSMEDTAKEMINHLIGDRRKAEGVLGELKTVVNDSIG
ncbi:MAG TPA: hypothetical protein ENH62_02445 [Marinobacter sp.]|uniref:Uncharacterized protein n=1 Tax=marine sediment metagenome TaxID=412755 RepID=A0A0F9SZL8_9ZZZZ|nr:hypothetical protein [Marinobacter sp.]